MIPDHNLFDSPRRPKRHGEEHKSSPPAKPGGRRLRRRPEAIDASGAKVVSPPTPDSRSWPRPCQRQSEFEPTVCKGRRAKRCSPIPPHAAAAWRLRARRHAGMDPATALSPTAGGQQKRAGSPIGGAIWRRLLRAGARGRTRQHTASVAAMGTRRVDHPSGSTQRLRPRLQLLR